MALSLLLASSLAAAAQPAPAGAPMAPATALYCLRVDPSVGSRMETIRCETREGWALLDVDVDAEWATWGVRVVSAPPLG